MGAEPVPQRRREKPGPGRRADERERLELELERPRRRPLADDDVELEVLHRRIEHLLDDTVQAMDLVDEEHVAALEVGEDRGDVARPLEDRPRRAAQLHPHLLGDDVGERRLAETRGAGEQHVVEDVLARARGVDRDREVALHRRLSDVLGERRRTERDVERHLLVDERGIDDGPFHAHAHLPSCGGATIPRRDERAALTTRASAAPRGSAREAAPSPLARRSSRRAPPPAACSRGSPAPRSPRRRQPRP